MQTNTSLCTNQRDTFLKELHSLRKKYVELPISANQYVLEKFSKDDLELVMRIDALLH